MAKCPICGGTGDTTNNIPPTNEQWFCSLPTEKKAEQLHMISCISLESKEDDIRWWVDWLKKEHEE